jgi:hypothetical protein
LCSKIKEAKEIVMSGDGRHDSMGHSAKYCAYTLFCHDPFNVIFDFSLVQVSINVLILHHPGYFAGGIHPPQIFSSTTKNL